MNQPKSGKVGGARPGAGRPRGSANAKTREIADKAAEQGTTPLEVMLQTMQAFLDVAKEQATSPDPDKQEVLKLMVAASNVAKDAAPYIHPRLQAIEHTGKNGGPLQFEAVLAEIAGALKA